MSSLWKQRSRGMQINEKYFYHKERGDQCITLVYYKNIKWIQMISAIDVITLPNCQTERNEQCLSFS